MSRTFTSMKKMRHAGQLFTHRRTLWQMLGDVIHGRYRMSMMTNLALLLSVIYIISPIDLITDFLPLIGWADDGVVFYLLTRRLVSETHRYNRIKAMHRREAASKSMLEQH